MTNKQLGTDRLRLCLRGAALDDRARAARRMSWTLAWGAALICIGAMSVAPALAADPAPLIAQEEQAIRNAVAKAAPAVVRIETIGGPDRGGAAALAAGPSTGVVLTPDGYIVTSAFAFAQQPASILVILSDGMRLAAQRVATDHSRQLVLLKCNPPQALPIAEAAADAELRVGQWSIALGRTYDSEGPSVSVGVLSAVRRIFGKAVQTDAKISPTNYGGPLIDIRGRVIGILTPLSPQAADAVSGAEWYDSGIGFAAPLEEILRVLPRWQAGEDLHPGVLGVNLKGGDPYADPAIVAAARPNSPAYEAGLKAEDRIIAIDGKAVARQSEAKQYLGPKYAGESVLLTLKRGEEQIERKVTLVAKLEPYVHPFLGILPTRDNRQSGVGIRYVYPDSPAAKAGWQPGDVIVSLGGEPVKSRADLLEKLAPLAAEEKTTVEIQRNGKSSASEITFAPLPEKAPEELPAEAKFSAGADTPTTIKLPEFAQDALSYIPQAAPDRAYGLVVWLNANGAYDEAQAKQWLEDWKPVCDARGLIAVAPRSSDGTKWDPAKDAEFIRKVADQIKSSQNLDPARIVVAGQRGGAAMAYVLLWQHRDLFRAVAAIDGVPAGQAQENEPIYRLAFWAAAAADTTEGKVTLAGAGQLRNLKYPVTILPLDKSRDLTAEERAGLGIWIDALDRF